MKIIKTFENFLNERLMNVENDVDYIYNKYFKQCYDYIKNHDKINKDLIIRDSFPTSDLNSALCKKADSLNPCTIFINSRNFRGSHYKPSTHEISIKMNDSAIEHAKDYDTIYQASEILRGRKIVQFKNEFLESSIKSTIHHELAHWIDDTLHNTFLAKILTNRTKPVENVDSTMFEIQAQVHTIYQIKKLNNDIWNEISFHDMIEMSPSLTTIFNYLPEEIKIKWEKDLKRRMAREGLLGKNMR